MSDRQLFATDKECDWRILTVEMESTTGFIPVGTTPLSDTEGRRNQWNWHLTYELTYTCRDIICKYGKWQQCDHNFTSLKLKTIHKCFLHPYKRQSSMLCFIAFRFSRVTEVMLQIKRAIGKAILYKLPIYKEYMCLCWVSTLFCMMCCLFSNCSKSSTTRLRSLYIAFYLCCKCATFICGHTPLNVMKRSIEICLL